MMTIKDRENLELFPSMVKEITGLRDMVAKLRDEKSAAEQKAEQLREALKSVAIPISECDPGTAISYGSIISLALSSTPPTGWVRINRGIIVELASALSQTTCHCSEDDNGYRCRRCIALNKLTTARTAANHKDNQ